MKEHGIDGVYMQRFVAEIKSEIEKNHFNKILANALETAKNMGELSVSCTIYADMDFIA